MIDKCKKIFFLNNKYCKINFIVYTLFGIISGICTVGIVILQRNFVDNVVDSIENGLTKSSIISLIFLGIIFFIQYIMEIISYFISSKTNIRLKDQLDEKILDKTSRLSYELIEDKSTQDLMKRIKNPSDKVMNIFEQYKITLSVLIQIIGIVFILIQTSIIVVVGIGIFIFIGIKLNKRTAQVTYGFWQKYMNNARRFNYISSILINRDYALEKKLFGYTNGMNNKFGKEFDKAQNKNKQSGKERLKSQTFMSIYGILYTILCFAILLPYLLKGEITIGFYFAVTGFIVNLFSLLNDRLEKIIEYQEYKKYLNDLYEFFNKEEKKGINANVLNSNFREIQFKDVYFKYPNQDKEVLSGVNFKIQKGKHYAIVGRNGVGKSTIIKLLLGLYRPQSGQILVDGENLSEMPQNKINGYFSTVFQDYCKYPLTLEENISIGSINEEHLTEEILDILDKVGISRKISLLPKKLKTNMLKLKSDGIDFSGGEWQKIAIGRMLLADRPVRILDEPTASLDPIAEAEMYNMYDKYLKGITTIFISHRLGSTKLANEILVLNNGKIQEIGSHQQLIDKEGLYYLLFTKQRGLYQ